MSVPQNSAPQANATEADVLADHINKLRLARNTIKMATEIEKEEKGIIGDYLSEREVEYGTVNGAPVIRRTVQSRRAAPKDLVPVVFEILAKVYPEILTQIDVPALNELAAEVIDRHSKTTTFAKIEFVA